MLNLREDIDWSHNLFNKVSIIKTMSDIINKLHRYMRIGLNRSGQFPDQKDLMEKLSLDFDQFSELIIEAQESGRDIKPETFELNQYTKLDINIIRYGTENTEPFGYKDFIIYKKKLSEEIAYLDFSDDHKTEKILELAGTIVNFLEILINKINPDLSNENKNHFEKNYEEVMSIYDKEGPIIKKKQLEISIDKFLDPFESIFFKIGIIFESYDTQITEPYSEQDMINKYNNLNFNEIESFLKLYEDGQLK